MENHSKETPEKAVKHTFFIAFGIYVAFLLSVILFVL